MNLIADVSKRESAELQERLSEYESTIMFVSHNGDLFDIDGFTVIRVKTVVDLAHAQPGFIIALGDEEVRIAELVRQYSDVLGFNAVVLDDVQGQASSSIVDAELGQFHHVSFLRVLNDIADKRLVEANMTKSELDASVAKRQDSMIRTKAGEIRPLIDFDRGYDSDSEKDIAHDDGKA